MADNNLSDRTIPEESGGQSAPNSVSSVAGAARAAEATAALAAAAAAGDAAPAAAGQSGRLSQRVSQGRQQTPPAAQPPKQAEVKKRGFFARLFSCFGGGGGEKGSQLCNTSSGSASAGAAVASVPAAMPTAAAVEQPVLSDGGGLLLKRSLSVGTGAPASFPINIDAAAAGGEPGKTRGAAPGIPMPAEFDPAFATATGGLSGAAPLGSDASVASVPTSPRSPLGTTAAAAAAPAPVAAGSSRLAAMASVGSSSLLPPAQSMSQPQQRSPLPGGAVASRRGGYALASPAGGGASYSGNGPQPLRASTDTGPSSLIMRSFDGNPAAAAMGPATAGGAAPASAAASPLGSSRGSHRQVARSASRPGSALAAAAAEAGAGRGGQFRTGTSTGTGSAAPVSTHGHSAERLQRAISDGTAIGAHPPAARSRLSPGGARDRRATVEAAMAYEDAAPGTGAGATAAAGGGSHSASPNHVTAGDATAAPVPGAGLPPLLFSDAPSLRPAAAAAGSAPSEAPLAGTVATAVAALTGGRYSRKRTRATHPTGGSLAHLDAKKLAALPLEEMLETIQAAIEADDAARGRQSQQAPQQHLSADGAVAARVASIRRRRSAAGARGNGAAAAGAGAGGASTAAVQMTPGGKGGAADGGGRRRRRRRVKNPKRATGASNAPPLAAVASQPQVSPGVPALLLQAQRSSPAFGATAAAGAGATAAAAGSAAKPEWRHGGRALAFNGIGIAGAPALPSSIGIVISPREPHTAGAASAAGSASASAAARASVDSYFGLVRQPPYKKPLLSRNSPSPPRPSVSPSLSSPPPLAAMAAASSSPAAPMAAPAAGPPAGHTTLEVGPAVAAVLRASAPVHPTASLAAAAAAASPPLGTTGRAVSRLLLQSDPAAAAPVTSSLDLTSLISSAGAGIGYSRAGTPTSMPPGAASPAPDAASPSRRPALASSCKDAGAVAAVTMGKDKAGKDVSIAAASGPSEAQLFSQLMDLISRGMEVEQNVLGRGGDSGDAAKALAQAPKPQVLATQRPLPPPPAVVVPVMDVHVFEEQHPHHRQAHQQQQASRGYQLLLKRPATPPAATAISLAELLSRAPPAAAAAAAAGAQEVSAGAAEAGAAEAEAAAAGAVVAVKPLEAEAVPEDESFHCSGEADEEVAEEEEQHEADGGEEQQEEAEAVDDSSLPQPYCATTASATATPTAAATEAMASQAAAPGPAVKVQVKMSTLESAISEALSADVPQPPAAAAASDVVLHCSGSTAVSEFDREQQAASGLLSRTSTAASDDNRAAGGDGAGSISGASASEPLKATLSSEAPAMTKLDSRSVSYVRLSLSQQAHAQQAAAAPPPPHYAAPTVASAAASGQRASSSSGGGGGAAAPSEGGRRVSLSGGGGGGARDVGRSPLRQRAHSPPPGSYSALAAARLSGAGINPSPSATTTPTKAPPLPPPLPTAAAPAASPARAVAPFTLPLVESGAAVAAVLHSTPSVGELSSGTVAGRVSGGLVDEQCTSGATQEVVVAPGCGIPPAEAVAEAEAVVEAVTARGDDGRDRMSSSFKAPASQRDLGGSGICSGAFESVLTAEEVEEVAAEAAAEEPSAFRDEEVVMAVAVAGVAAPVVGAAAGAALLVYEAALSPRTSAGAGWDATVAFEDIPASSHAPTPAAAAASAAVQQAVAAPAAPAAADPPAAAVAAVAAISVAGGSGSGIGCARGSHHDSGSIDLDAYEKSLAEFDPYLNSGGPAPAVVKQPVP